MTFKAHLKIVQHPNSEIRTFHVNRDVCNVLRFGFGKKNIDSIFDHRPDELTARLATALGYIPGVQEGALQQYDISITKGSAFEWADITPYVVGQIVAKVFPDLIGESLEISTSVHYLVGTGYSQYDDIAKRFGVMIELDPNDPNPAIDIEFLFDPRSPRLVVNNDIKPVAKKRSRARKKNKLAQERGEADLESPEVQGAQPQPVIGPEDGKRTQV